MEVSKKIGSGFSVFSEGNYQTNSLNRPDEEYAKLVEKVLKETDSLYDIDTFMNRLKYEYM